MKTVSISKQSKSVNALLDQARQESLLLRTEDGSEFVLSAVDDFEQEVASMRRNRKLMALLERRARQTETMPLEQIRRRLRLNPLKKRSGTRVSKKKSSS